ncbi:MAG: hypothetical protein RL227_2093 [Pseudomonadota bacterium]
MAKPTLPTPISSNDSSAPHDRELLPGQKLRRRSNEAGQGMTVDRLLKKPIEGPALPNSLVFGRADEDQHRRGVLPSALTDFSRESQAIRVGHLQIDQHNVKVRVGDQRTGFARRRSRAACVARSAAATSRGQSPCERAASRLWPLQQGCKSSCCCLLRCRCCRQTSASPLPHTARFALLKVPAEHLQRSWETENVR